MRKWNLFSEVNEVERVEEERKNIEFLIKELIDGGGEEIEIRMRIGEELNELGWGKKEEEEDIGWEEIFKIVDRGNGRVGGGKNRIEKDKEEIEDILRWIEVILDRMKSVVVEVEEDMGEERGRKKIENKLKKEVKWKKDGREKKIIELKKRGLNRNKRGLNRNGGKLEIESKLVEKKKRNIIKKKKEDGSGSIIIENDGKIVMEKRMDEECKENDF